MNASPESWSADGKWLAYTANDGKTSNEPRALFVQAISSQGRAAGIPYRVSPDGPFGNAYWGRGGKEVIYSSTRRVMAVPLTLGATVQLGTPQTLFEMPQGAELMDVGRSGERFLIQVPVGEVNPVNPLRVVLNWQQRLKR